MKVGNRKGKRRATHLCPAPRVKDHVRGVGQLDEALSAGLLDLDADGCAGEDLAEVADALERRLRDAALFLVSRHSGFRCPSRGCLD